MTATAHAVPLTLVIAAVDAGLCVLPPKENGSKAPLAERVTLKSLTALLEDEALARAILGTEKGQQREETWTWTHYQYKRPSMAKVNSWYGPASGKAGLGVVCGHVSGKVSAVDFDERRTYLAFKTLAIDTGLGELVERIERGYLDRTPNGTRWLIRCEETEPSSKLALRPLGNNKFATLIEVKGEGGYAIIRGTGGAVHPSGQSYEAVSGSFDSIAVITPTERDALYTLARTFDEQDEPADDTPRTGKQKGGAEGRRPGDVFNERATWPEVLEPAGWTLTRETKGAGYWKHPATDKPVSATTNARGTNKLVVFSTSTPFPKVSPSSYDLFSAFTYLHHGGDFSAAAAAINSDPRYTARAAHEDDPPAAAGPPPEPRTLQQVIATFNKWLYLEDTGIIYATLATMAANYMTGDPLWLMLVGASSGGKTETMNALGRLPHVHKAATMTEGALLSGTSQREKASDAKGGLLRKIGKFGVLLCKDFTSILSMNRDPRALLLAALREIYDGEWTRHVGVDGGRTLSWQGKLGLIAGCTAAIDSHHAVMATMGERFLLWRLPNVNPRKQARKALANNGKEQQLRQELSEAVAGFFASLQLPGDPPELSDAALDRLIAVASLVARCRSAVERDGRTREIELILDSEAPARIAQALRRLYGGLLVIGLDDAMAWVITRKCGLDCMPKIRRGVFDVLAGNDDWTETTAIAAAVGYPTLTARRALEELVVHGVAQRRPAPKGKADTWKLTHWARSQYTQATESEKSVDSEGGSDDRADGEEPLKSPHSAYDDFSDSVPGDHSEPYTKEREAVCWSCKASITTGGDDACDACGWIRCTCGACAKGCAREEVEW